MHYFEIYDLLKNKLPQGNDIIEIPELKLSVKKYNLESKQASAYLSGSESLNCKQHNLQFEEHCFKHLKNEYGVEMSDYAISCNLSFSFYILSQSFAEKANGFIILFHGLNEKSWNKYLPWAYELAKQTGKAIVLFPIAFHIDRAPDEWGVKHLMLKLTQERNLNNPENIASSSYINAAISSRLEYYPQRLFWSGFQTYADVVQLIESINNNEIEEIAPNATVDLFGYSIGSFFTTILKIGNPKNYFTNSKVFCFCGGMTIDRMFPISKYIMDASAAIAMQSKYAELLSSNFETDKRLSHFQDSNLHASEAWFKTMLRYNYYLEERESALRNISHQIKAYVLKQDVVAPPVEALNTLKGGYRDIPIEVTIDDYSYPYSHVNPFSLVHKYKVEVDAAFGSFTKAAADFLK